MLDNQASARTRPHAVYKVPLKKYFSSYDIHQASIFDKYWKFGACLRSSLTPLWTLYIRTTLLYAIQGPSHLYKLTHHASIWI
jgi:hypothetical protein